MRQNLPTVAALLVACWMTWAAPVVAGPTKCSPDAVRVGATCIDRYEESVWQIAPQKKSLIKKVLAGKATLKDLQTGGAVQLAAAGSCNDATAYGVTFPDTGNWVPVLGSNPPTPGIFAVSIPGVLPSACSTWFQASEACALVGKRLPRNGEWQQAAAGTPDPGTDNGTTDCAIMSAGPVKTGSRTNCKSNWGVFDMVGNLMEWVEDWTDLATTNSGNWSTDGGLPGDDVSLFGGPGNADGVHPQNSIPGTPVRGGYFGEGASAGVFTTNAGFTPADSNGAGGFRCAR